MPPSSTARGKTVPSTSSPSVRMLGVGDRRCIVANPHCPHSTYPLPPILSASPVSSATSETSDSSEFSDSSDSAEPPQLVKSAVPLEQSTSSVQPAPLGTVDPPNRPWDSKLSEPSASPSFGCLPVVTAENPTTPGTRPPFSSSSDSDTLFSDMDTDLEEVDLYRETDGVILNAMDRHSDTASPQSPTSTAWLQAEVAVVTATDLEAARPPIPASPAR